MLARRKPLKRNASPLKRSPIRRVTKKRRRQLEEYAPLRVAYLAAHPVCEVWCSENRWRWINHRTYEGSDAGKLRIEDATTLFRIGAPEATEIHHTNKRRGAMLNDEQHWLAVCRANHERIENNKAWAREQGFLLNF